MQTECMLKLFEFEAVDRRSVVLYFDGGNITPNAGALLLGQVDRGLGLVRRFADCFIDRRDPCYVEHQVETLVGQRIVGLALGYEDLNDHDELRKDPTFAVLAGKLSPVLRTDCEPLAGKSTLNRLEHTPRRHASKYRKIDCNGAQVDALLVDPFLETYARAPCEIVLDLHNTDIPLHGEQEGRFYHGYYDEYCYLPLYVFCGRHLLLARQRGTNVAGRDGAVEEVARIVAQIRQRWPRVRIILRADSGFSDDALMGWCEANRVDYEFGPARIGVWRLRWSIRLRRRSVYALPRASRRACSAGSSIARSTAGAARAGLSARPSTRSTAPILASSSPPSSAPAPPTKRANSTSSSTAPAARPRSKLAIHFVGLLHRRLLGLAADSGPHGSVNGASPPSGITAQRRQPEGGTVLIEKVRSLETVATQQPVSRLRFTKTSGTVNDSGFNTLPVHVQPVLLI
jgi:hypothetical protein